MEGPEADFTPFGVIWESESDSDWEEEEDDQETDLSQEMAETKEKMAEIEQASQALLAELSTMEMEYAIEKACREQAEAFAIQVSRENKKLQRISLALLPRLALQQEDLVGLSDGEEGAAPDSALDPMGRCLQQVKDLQLKVSGLLEEKKELTTQVKELLALVGKLQHQLEEECAEKQSLKVLKEHNRKMLKRVKQASRLVTEQYGRMSRQLDMEEKLRQQAEIFARQMLLKQKEANRQSLILMQNVGAEAQLLLALEDVAQMTRRLEETKMEHEAKVKDLETQLAERPLPEELARLQATLATAEKGKAHLEQRLLRAEEKCASLERKVKVLEEGAQPPDAPEESPVVPVPPPPPLPPPTFPAKADPLMALRERKGAQQTKRGDLRSDEAVAKALEEMMGRIKGGVALRPVRRGAESPSQPPSAAVNKRRSAAVELQDLLSATTRPRKRSSRRKGSQKKQLVDNQLEKLLQRRRRIVDQAPVMTKPSIPAADQGLLPPVPGARGEDHAASPVRLPRGLQPNQSESPETSKGLPVKALEEGAQPPDAPEESPVVPVPPPPPLPPPTFPAKADPLMALRERKGAQQTKRGDLRSDEAVAKALEEMMGRIKGGVALRPVRRGAESPSQPPSAAVNKRRSAAVELQDLLSATTRPRKRSSRRKGSQKKQLVDNQLEKLLQRRRRIVDQAPVMTKPSIPAADQGLLPPVPGARGEDHAASPVRLPRGLQPNQSESPETSKGLPGEGPGDPAGGTATARGAGQAAGHIGHSRGRKGTPGAATSPGRGEMRQPGAKSESPGGGGSAPRRPRGEPGGPGPPATPSAPSHLPCKGRPPDGPSGEERRTADKKGRPPLGRGRGQSPGGDDGPDQGRSGAAASEAGGRVPLPECHEQATEAIQPA
ncbi:shootin-1-like isoform X2 [Crotalus tigris]|uniref:shootin-1-like isoform X2 n=1 Tax=Crotalus tigris TaxID=88082 RepID=UPI00192F5DD0|nr:shootin-1-like isoform X2 [Crotalus tigris]